LVLRPPIIANFLSRKPSPGLSDEKTVLEAKVVGTDAHKLKGQLALKLVTRLMGLLLAAVAVQFAVNVNTQLGIHA
jgi:hypothetical protein